MRRVMPAITGAIAIAVLIAGCGTEMVSASGAETTLAKAFKSTTGKTATHVSCPSDVDAKAGKRFYCQIASGGKSYVGEMTIEKVKGSSVYFKYTLYR